MNGNKKFNVQNVESMNFTKINKSKNYFAKTLITKKIIKKT